MTTIPHFELRSGGCLRNVRIAHSIHGACNATTILVLGGISAGRHLYATADAREPGWWPGLVGPGRSLDPAHHRLIGVDYIGGRGDSHADCDASRDDAPLISTHDHAALILTLFDSLGIRSLDAVVGASFGGMVALALCELAPERVARAIVIAAADHSDPMATAGRSLQRRIVELGVAGGEADAALSIARGMAITSYRSAREFRERFARAAGDDGANGNTVSAYLDHQGRKFATTFAHAGFIALSRALDAHRITPASITTPLTLIGFDSDTLVPPAQLTALARAIPSSTLTILPSRYGHDGFLKETGALNPIVQRALHSGSLAACAPATVAARAAIATDTQYGAVIPPLHLSSTFTFEEFGRARRYDYTRSGNPTRDQLGEAIAQLEGAANGIVTATGMSAVLLPLQLLRPGDLLLAPHDCYGGTHRLLTALAGRRAIELDFVDFAGDDVCDVIHARRPRMVWIETPSNPLLRITNIAEVCDAARSVGALAVVDNTFLSPVLQQPLTLGADIVIHSTTKYINGHSDVVGGAVVARDAALHGELAWWSNCLGITGSPFDAWLTLRGLRTLPVRIAAQQASAAAIADVLNSNASDACVSEGGGAVRCVHYPGLAMHPGHALAARQQTGFGAMLSFELHGGTAAARAFTDGLAAFSLAESLGGVESLVAHPATMTHASMPPAARSHAGITDGLLRLSIGLESVDDLIADIQRGLQRASAV
jgi:cystathionine gamma-synthase